MDKYTLLNTTLFSLSSCKRLVILLPIVASSALLTSCGDGNVFPEKDLVQGIGLGDSFSESYSIFVDPALDSVVAIEDTTQTSSSFGGAEFSRKNTNSAQNDLITRATIVADCETVLASNFNPEWWQYIPNSTLTTEATYVAARYYHCIASYQSGGVIEETEPEGVTGFIVQGDSAPFNTYFSADEPSVGEMSWKYQADTSTKTLHLTMNLFPKESVYRMNVDIQMKETALNKELEFSALNYEMINGKPQATSYAWVRINHNLSTNDQDIVASYLGKKGCSSIGDDNNQVVSLATIAERSGGSKVSYDQILQEQVDESLLTDSCRPAVQVSAFSSFGETTGESTADILAYMSAKKPEVLEQKNNNTEQLKLVTDIEQAKPAEPTPTSSFSKTPLNDTGIGYLGQSSSGNNATCDTQTSTEQDCSQGRDAQVLQKIGSGELGFDFTKLDADGHDLPASASTWSCVRDNHTGLIWEAKTDNGDHYKDTNYLWGGLTSIGRDHPDKQGDYHDSWNSLINTSNDQSLCSYNDWRVPTRTELVSITHKGKSNPAMDTNFFANTVASFYWVAEPYNHNEAWALDFKTGASTTKTRNSQAKLRLVTGNLPVYNQPHSAPVLSSMQTAQNYVINQWPNNRYINNGNNTITDRKTQLMWKTCAEGFSGSGCNNGSVHSYSWSQALAHATNTEFAGYKDWRLPNINELISLVTNDRQNPAINTYMFLNLPSITTFWSSSPYYDTIAANTSWYLDFATGVENHNFSRASDFPIRLVRDAD